ncbi:MAG: hypothetical protein IM516_04970 [Pseudanabaena sp. M158S2SP1A06QC]|jgi:hypothetical protein|nr:hypothetical protein [Pseudanabaena sp. M53BS1SP1A06MG]MCA6581799.1 hypothetical protein [Pseudanabaena sp. M34BS1SP1A06MG]MCA6585690.1 hypothetical protein [Pseudanabaena sp. M051S1SP1A06QC]MCA6591935.1 hypothetical protein [Pseudanabaena sp. M38BS1SP1A06MG]MCA6596902.1 hypothetical protein [Pseudanabaena sp. M046S1SP1A06QC]MCA6599002.1 hypothetical protein [Pseudanabaena sp. M57BS1SP1A06MG]MCA6611465.1 hypothetical protein [Pseudanabaena sp. M158S2SP1A06QC]MCA6623575.1 hypothetical prot
MIAVLPDESSAFEAYRLLQCHGISPENLALVGKGYSSPDSVGLFNPTHTTWRYAKRGMFWVGTFSILMGMFLHLIFNLQLPNLDWHQTLLMIASTSGIIGIAIGGVIGTLYGWFFKSSLSISCRNCLDRGQYLLMLEGSETLTRRGREILDSYTVKPY